MGNAQGIDAIYATEIDPLTPVAPPPFEGGILVHTQYTWKATPMPAVAHAWHNGRCILHVCQTLGQPLRPQASPVYDTRLCVTHTRGVERHLTLCNKLKVSKHLVLVYRARVL